MPMPPQIDPIVDAANLHSLLSLQTSLKPLIYNSIQILFIIQGVLRYRMTFKRGST